MLSILHFPLIIGSLMLFTPSVQAADRWTDISTSLLERLTNSGTKLLWPGGCSGVVANRLNGDVTIKVVGFGLWRSSDQCKTWQRIDGDRLGDKHRPELANENG